LVASTGSLKLIASATLFAVVLPLVGVVVVTAGGASVNVAVYRRRVVRRIDHIDIADTQRRHGQRATPAGSGA
jgi:hypothetical protein